MKAVYKGNQLVWKGGGLVLFESNKVNVGFEFFRRVGAVPDTGYYIGSDKIELSYKRGNTAIVVGIVSSIDITQFSNILVEYRVFYPSGVEVHIMNVACGVTATKTQPINRMYDIRTYTTHTEDSMLIDLSNFQYSEGSVDMTNCYVYIQLQPNNLVPTGVPKIEISKIELI